MLERTGKVSTERSDFIATRRQPGSLTLDLLGICCTCVVGVYLLRRRALVERHEPVQKVVACCVIIVATSIIGEVVAQW